MHLMKARETVILKRTEFRREIEMAKKSYRMGQVMYLLERDDLVAPFPLTAPATGEAGAADNTHLHGEWARRVLKERLAAAEKNEHVHLTLNDVAKLEESLERPEDTAFYRLEMQRMSKLVERIQAQIAVLKAGVLTETTCFCFGRSSTVRHTAVKVIQSRSFDVLINLVILASCIVVLLDRPSMTSKQAKLLEDIVSLLLPFNLPLTELAEHLFQLRLPP